MHALLVASLLVASSTPKAPVAWTSRDAWPHPVATAAQFDLASRAEILAFVEAFSQTGDEASVRPWRSSREALLLQNFHLAMATCATGVLLCPRRAPATWSELVGLALHELDALPPEYKRWREEALTFHGKYVRELLRLALLSGRISSEILAVGEGEEFGESFADRSFLLTFDDGPTGAAGETDRVMRLLSEREQHALFFTVGTAMHARRTIDGLYDGQCLASHGMAHESHVTSALVAGQLPAWNAELAALEPEGTKLRWFRPPFGQRTAAQVEQLRGEGLGVMLWNIDSQDWQAPKDTTLVAGRVLTLMLLWRRGVILFHDVHPAAREALPLIFGSLDGGAVNWLDCRAL
jgi:peptidoglycan/xylan/chitin deacetylase (PgdA/CDA1 family)